MEDSKLPQDLNNALIFTSNALTILKGRVGELQNEKLAHQRHFKELKKQHRQLLKDLKVKKALIEVEKKHCEDVQMLKFGQIIDLSILSKVGEDEGAAELRAKLKMLEESSVKKLTEWDRKISAAKDEMSKVTQQNTVWLEKVARLTQAQYQLENQLNKNTTNVNVSDSGPADDKAEAERRQILHLVQVQEKEIDALKAEIHVLRRKSGHVYTPQ